MLCRHTITNRSLSLASCELTGVRIKESKKCDEEEGKEEETENERNKELMGKGKIMQMQKGKIIALEKKIEMNEEQKIGMQKTEKQKENDDRKWRIKEKMNCNWLFRDAVIIENIYC